MPNNKIGSLFDTGDALSDIAMPGHLQDRGRYCRVCAATADIPIHPLDNLFSSRRWIVQKQRLGHHELAGRTKAALKAHISNKGLLKRVELIPY